MLDKSNSKKKRAIEHNREDLAGDTGAVRSIVWKEKCSVFIIKVICAHYEEQNHCRKQ
jgi:hypothetical protein